jgi:OOP family OmpA-OmpF porin
MNSRSLQLSVLVLAVSVAGPAAAGSYIGAGAGQASLDACDDLKALGATRCDDEDTGFKIFGGIELNENIAFEGSYLDYGEVTASDEEDSLSGDLTAVTFSVVGMIPLNEQFSILAKLGFAFWDAEVSVSGQGSIDENDTDLFLGLGAGFDFTETLGIRGEWERIDVDGDDADLLSISAVLKF